jgi:hypothetical protein
MPKRTHNDFYKRLEQLEARVSPHLVEQQRAFEAIYTATPESAKAVALNKYRRAVNATFRATDRLWKFLDKYQP